MCDCASCLFTKAVRASSCDQNYSYSTIRYQKCKSSSVCGMGSLVLPRIWPENNNATSAAVVLEVKDVMMGQACPDVIEKPGEENQS